MKAIVYDRTVKSPTHAHASTWDEMIYVPDRDVIFYRELHGSFSSQTYGLNDNKVLLEEINAVLILNEESPEKMKFAEGDRAITIKKTIDIPDKDVDTLIEIIKARDIKEEKLRTPIDNYLGAK